MRYVCLFVLNRLGRCTLRMVQQFTRSVARLATTRLRRVFHL